MNREQQFFLNCLGDHIQYQETIVPDVPLAPELLFRIASGHSLAGIIYSQCYRWAWQHKEWAGMHNAFLGDVFYYENRKKMLRDIVESFQKAGIPLICMKGTVLSGYYPTPEFRTMGDIDIIIRPEDRQETDRIMREVLGYRSFVDNHAVWTYLLEHDRFQVEIHDHMFYDPLANNVDYRAYFDQIWNHCHRAPVYGFSYDNLYVPDEDYHFLYLMTHTAKHVINSGNGFRAYLDMVMVCDACRDRINWGKITEELEKLKLLEFTKRCFRLCERWFNVAMPLSGDELEEEFFNDITEKTFADGVFGLENEANNRAKAARDIKKDGGSYTAGAVKNVIRKLFPPYKDLQLIPWYSFVDGRPWLTPAAWVYRWFYCAVKKFKHSSDLLTEPFTKKQGVLDRESYLERWGL